MLRIVERRLHETLHRQRAAMRGDEFTEKHTRRPYSPHFA